MVLVFKNLLHTPAHSGQSHRLLASASKASVFSAAGSSSNTA